MSTRSRREAASRAEARRRARLVAQGDVPEDAEPLDEATSSRSRGAATPQGGFLQRMFPATRPLPGKPDPLDGFTYDGPLRGVVSTLWLLARNPLIWIAAGVLFALSYVVQQLFASSYLSLAASMVSFIALIGAGWLGWQRPYAFGLAAGLIGSVLFTSFILLNLQSLPSVPAPTVVDAIVFIAQFAIVQAAVGAVAGFYGGYLRRRLAEAPSQRTDKRRR